MMNQFSDSLQKDTLFSGAVLANIRGQCGTSQWKIALADNFWQRFCGLMLKPTLNSHSGLLISRCNSVHTTFMRAPIDVVYLDQDGRIVKCVPSLKPWRFSIGGRTAMHCLELATGSIERCRLQCGDILEHPYFTPSLSNIDTRIPTETPQNVTDARNHQSTTSVYSKFSHEAGATMIEFLLVGPIITLLGLGILQYGMLFFAKNNINHAAFMAARAGSVANANLTSVENAYAKALIPLYGGGRDATELNESLLSAEKDVAVNSRIELLNPTKESFDDWSDDALKDTIGQGKRVIPNGGQTVRDTNKIGASSGQNIQDANLIKLRITHGYEMKIPFIKPIMQLYLKWLDPKTDDFHTQLVASGRIPVVTNVTLQMQSDAIEPENPVSSPGQGNNGNPVDPGDPPTGGTDNPPQCGTVGCTTTPTTNGSNGDSSPSCTGVMESVSSDVMFDFNSTALKPGAKAELDRIIAEAKTRDFSSLTIRGYTDQIGSADINAKLSLDRANAVRDYLRTHGFPADKQINTEGKGSSDPVVPLSSCPDSSTQQSCLAANRRVTFTWNKA